MTQQLTNLLNQVNSLGFSMEITDYNDGTYGLSNHVDGNFLASEDTIASLLTDVINSIGTEEEGETPAYLDFPPDGYFYNPEIQAEEEFYARQQFISSPSKAIF